MKKSEMIEKIKVYMNIHYRDEIPWGTDDGELILKMIEEAGMQPPQVRVPGRWHSRNDNCIWEDETMTGEEVKEAIKEMDATFPDIFQKENDEDATLAETAENAKEAMEFMKEVFERDE